MRGERLRQPARAAAGADVCRGRVGREEVRQRSVPPAAAVRMQFAHVVQWRRRRRAARGRLADASCTHLMMRMAERPRRRLLA